MALDIQLTETMRGLHHFTDPDLGEARDRRMWFTIDWRGAPSAVLNPLSRTFMVFDAAGVMYVEGLTEPEVECEGTLAVDYFRTQTIKYDLAFDVEGVRYRYKGEKVEVNLARPLELIKTHTTCYGSTTRDGRIISRSVTHFDLRTAVPFVTSFRLV